MGFSRLIIIAAIIWLSWFLYQRFRQNMANRQQETTKKSHVESSTIVKCIVCGLHVPKGEAIENKGNFYCGEIHKNL